MDIGASSIQGSLKISAVDEYGNNIKNAKERLTVFNDNEARNEDRFEKNVAQKVAEFELRHKEDILKVDKENKIKLTVCYPGPPVRVNDKVSGFLLSNFFYDNNRRKRFAKTINPDNIDKNLRNFIKDKKQFDVAIIDPPRKGSTPQALENIAKMTSKTIYYVSCNPQTLARDSEILQKNGFELKFVQGADMFAHSYHIETIAIFNRQ